MNSKRSLLTFTGGACVLMGVFVLVIILCHIAGLGLKIVTVEEDSPDSIVRLFLNGWYQTALGINILAYIILIPALVGIYAFLKRIAKGYTIIGLAFGVIALGLLLLSQLIEAGLILWLTNIGLEQSYSIKNDAFLIHRVANFFSEPALIPYLLSCYFIGTAFKRFETQDRLIGSLLLSVIPIVVIRIVLGAFGLNTIASVGVIIEALLMAVIFIFAGQTLFINGKNEPAPL